MWEIILRDSCLEGFAWPGTREELEFLTDIRDFTPLVYVILRRKSPEWLESSIESDLGQFDLPSEALT